MVLVLAVVVLVELVEDVVGVDAGLVVEGPTVLGDEDVDVIVTVSSRGQVADATDVVDRVLLEVQCELPSASTPSGISPTGSGSTTTRSLIGSVAVFLTLIV